MRINLKGRSKLHYAITIDITVMSSDRPNLKYAREEEKRGSNADYADGLCEELVKAEGTAFRIATA